MTGEGKTIAGTRVLVVEDDLMIRMLLEGMLTDLGHTVAAEAGGIDEAVVIAKKGGSITITVASGAASATATVTVTAVPVSKIVIAPTPSCSGWVPAPMSNPPNSAAPATSTISCRNGCRRWTV